jgi:hypothetical protein
MKVRTEASITRFPSPLARAHRTGGAAYPVAPRASYASSVARHPHLRWIRSTSRLRKRDRLERADQQGRRAETERVLAASPIAPHYSAFSQLYADTRGRLWVAEYPTPGSDTALLTAFDEYGESGTITLPRGFFPRQIGDDYILGVAIDELRRRVHQVVRTGAPLTLQDSHAPLAQNVRDARHRRDGGRAAAQS